MPRRFFSAALFLILNSAISFAMQPESSEACNFGALAKNAFPLARGQEIAKYFLVVAANSSLSNAQVIIVGDRHAIGRPTEFDIRRSQHANELINSIAQNGDWLLLEGRKYNPNTPETKSPDATTDSIERRLNFTGWEDDKDLNAASAAMGRFIMQQARGQLLPKSTDSSAASRDLDQTVVSSRNRSLFKNISSHLRLVGDGSRIFITAGRAHVTEAQIISELEQSGIRFVILASPQ